MDHYKETAATWNKLANLYEERFMDLTIYNESYDFLCAKITNPYAKVLEVGCGPGMIARYLLSKRPQLQILGTDLAPSMIAVARENVPGAQFEILDSREICSLNQNFDAIVSGFCIPYLSSEDAQQFISDAGKIINQNGLLYLSFIPGAEEQSGYQTGSSGDRVYFYYHPEEDIIQQLEKSGFKLLKRLVIPFERANGMKEEHLVLILKLHDSLDVMISNGMNLRNIEINTMFKKYTDEERRISIELTSCTSYGKDDDLDFNSEKEIRTLTLKTVLKVNTIILSILSLFCIYDLFTLESRIFIPIVFLSVFLGLIVTFLLMMKLWNLGGKLLFILTPSGIIHDDYLLSWDKINTFCLRKNGYDYLVVKEFRKEEIIIPLNSLRHFESRVCCWVERYKSAYK